MVNKRSALLLSYSPVPFLIEMALYLHPATAYLKGISNIYA
jgi:hypothetical protein